MFPDDVYIVDPFKNNLYKISDSVESKVGNTENGPRSVLVMQDQIHVLTANSCDNSISVFRNGVREKDIEVGKMPWAICEDINGNIYVACYGDSTVVKIDVANWVVENTIQVSKGPRGIVSDMDGNIWVACYLTNKLMKIVNTKVVQSVDTANNPCGITCDPMNNIWVTSYSSNIVSKITNGKKILDVETGQGPIDVVSTSEGTIYVVGYLDDSITMIENTGKGDIYGLEKSTFGTVNGPCSIGVDSQDNIYVTSELGTTVKKYKGKTEQAEFNPCGNPTGYGDMTGCATRNVINQKSKAYGVYTAPADGWQMTDLSVTIQKLLQMVQDGNVNTSSDLVTYTNQASITNVEEALDSLFQRREESDNASNVIYKNNNQTTVESALNDLYERNIDGITVIYDHNDQKTVTGALDELFATRTAGSITYNQNGQKTVLNALNDLYDKHATLDAGDVAYTNNDNTTVLGALDELYSMNIPAIRIDYNRNSQTNVEGALSDIYTRLSKITVEGDASNVNYTNSAPGYESIDNVQDMLDKLEDIVTQHTTDITGNKNNIETLEDRVDNIELSGGAGGTVTSINADKVKYTNNSQTTAQSAFDNIYTTLGTKVDDADIADMATNASVSEKLANYVQNTAIADMLTKTEASTTYVTNETLGTTIDEKLEALDPTNIDYTNNEQTSVSGALDDLYTKYEDLESSAGSGDSANVTYDNNEQTTVEGALDNLYTKVESLESASVESLEASKVTYTKNSQANVDGALDDVYNKLGQKADSTALANYTTTEALNGLLAAKADKTAIATMNNPANIMIGDTSLTDKLSAVDSSISAKADSSAIADMLTKTEANSTYVTNEKLEALDPTNIDYTNNEQTSVSGALDDLYNKVESLESASVESLDASKVTYTKNSQANVDGALDDVYNKLGQKADSTALANYATTESLTSGLAGKADTTAIADMLTKTEASTKYVTNETLGTTIDEKLEALDPANIDYTNNEQTTVEGALDNLYTKVESLESASVESLEATKVTYTKNSQANVDGALDDVYNKLGQKADTTTLEQYLKKEELATEIADVPIDSNDTTYTNNSQTTVGGALDDIYTNMNKPDKIIVGQDEEEPPGDVTLSDKLTEIDTALGKVVTNDNLAEKVAELNITSDKVTYTKNDQTTTDGALDDVYNKLGQKADTTTLEQYLKKTELATEVAGVTVDSNKTSYTNNSQTTVSGALDNIYTTLGSVITDSNLGDKVTELDIAANKVTYTKNSQTTVDGALDNIYTKLGELGTTEEKKTTYYWTCSGILEDNTTPSVTIAEAGNITEVCASVDLKSGQTTPGQDITIKVQKAGTTEATFSDISTATVVIGNADTTFIKTVSITEAVAVNDRIRVTINTPASNNVEFVGVRLTETITTE